MNGFKTRSHTHISTFFSRVKAFFTGAGPFVNRAMLVGAVQIGTYDSFRDYFRKEWGVVNNTLNVFYSSMASGIIYSVVTMPFETAKNRMAFQKPDPITGNETVDKVPY